MAYFLNAVILVKGRETIIRSTRAKRTLERYPPSPTTWVICPIGLIPSPPALGALQPRPAASPRYPRPYGLSRQNRSRTVTVRGRYRPATWRRNSAKGWDIAAARLVEIAYRLGTEKDR